MVKKLTVLKLITVNVQTGRNNWIDVRNFPREAKGEK